MRREDAIKRADEYFSALRTSNSDALKHRESEIRSKYPVIDDLLRERTRLPLKGLRAVLGGTGHSKSLSEDVKNEGLRLNREIRNELCKAGYPDDYLSMHYECRECRDTGYLEGIPPVMCSCFIRRVNELMREDDGVSDFARMSFETFDPNRIPEDEIAAGITQRSFTERVKDVCEDYADSFPDTIKSNIVLSGPAGVGKTFLLNCIAGRVESKGYNVTIVTAYRLLEAMRDKHLNISGNSGEFDKLLSCPLLLIDDLGSEPILRNITREYLGLLINERMLRKLHTVITCNLTRAQICEMYDERIMSRLCDRESWDFINLKGMDIRRYEPGRS